MTPPSIASTTTAERRRRRVDNPTFVRRYAVPLLVLLTGIVSSAVFTFQLSRAVSAKDYERFESNVEASRGRILSRLNTYTALLRAGAGLFAADPELTQQQFAAYIAQLDLPKNYPGIQGIGWTRKIAPEERHEILEHYPGEERGFRIWPDTPREEYHAILFLEPLDERNRAALGYDMFTESTRRAAMEAARDSGSPAATGKVTLVQEIDERKQAGFLIYLPVYRGGKAPSTVEARRDALIGFVYSPFRADDLFEGIFESEGRHRLNFRVFDGAEAREEALLHDSSFSERSSDHVPSYSEKSHIEVAGKLWTLEFVTRPEFEFASGRVFVPLVFGVGLLITLLLTGQTLSLTRARDAALQANEALFEQRERWRVTLASIGDGIIVTDPAGTIVFLNPVAEQLSGWTLQEAEGRTLEEVYRIVDEETREPARHRLEIILQEGAPLILPNHAFLISRDGAEYPIDESGAPIRDENDTLIGVVLVFRDITERRSAEAELRMHGHVLESMTEGVCITDHNGIIIYTNPSEDRMFGYERGELLGRHMTAQNSYPPEENKRIVAEVIETLNREGMWFGEWSNRRKDGSLFTSEARITTLERDGMRYFVCVQHDVTERKLAAQRLEEERATSEALNEVAPSLASTLDLDTLVQRATDAATQLTGASFGAFFYNVEKSDGEAFLLYTLSGAPREAFERFPMPRNTAIFRPTFHGESTVRIDDVTKDSRYGLNAPYHGMPEGHLPVRSYLAVPVVSRTGEVLGGLFFGHPEPAVFDARAERIAVGIAAQASVGIENARLYEKVAENEGKFRTLADSMPQLVWMASPDGAVFWLNKRWYDYTGTTLERMAGSGWEQVIDPAELPRVREQWRAMTQSGEPLETVYPIRGANGRYRRFLTRVVPTRDREGRIVRWFGTNTDIEEQVEMERRLREADQRKDEFLAMLAHELRNPLASINLANKVLQVKGPAKADLERSSAVIERQVGHLARLLDDLLDVSRITRGKIELKRQAVDAAEIVARAVESAQPHIDGKQHQLTVSVADEPLPLIGDPVRLEQIFVNLLHNAAKYTEPGGKIALEAKRENDEVVIRLRDSGIGIPYDKQEEIFELFAQGERSLARSEGGLGIGLTVVQRLVQLHGGVVTARSEGLGRGSEFTVRLPTNAAQSTEQGASPLLVNSNRASRVLIVEDNQDTAASLAQLMRHLGHEVEIANDGLAAVAAVRRSRPDVVLLDIGLPGMDGYGVARLLRDQEGLARARIIAVSGYGQEEDRRRSEEAGIDFHLVKPVDFRALVSLISDVH